MVDFETYFFVSVLFNSVLAIAIIGDIGLLYPKFIKNGRYLREFGDMNKFLKVVFVCIGLVVSTIIVFNGLMLTLPVILGGTIQTLYIIMAITVVYLFIVANIGLIYSKVSEKKAKRRQEKAQKLAQQNIDTTINNRNLPKNFNQN